jgi:hypothetical protein
MSWLAAKHVSTWGGATSVNRSQGTECAHLFGTGDREHAFKMRREACVDVRQSVGSFDTPEP